MLIIGIESSLNASTSTTLNKDKIEYYSPSILTSTRLFSPNDNILELKYFNSLPESTSSNSNIDTFSVNHSTESFETISEYDVNIKMSIKRSFKAKAKIRSVKKITTKVFFD